MKLAQLAQLAQAELVGPGDVEITEVTDPDQAHPHALILVADARRLPAADASTAGALLVGTDAPATTKPALRARQPQAAFARVLAALAPFAPPPPGIHPTAVVAPGAAVGAGAYVGPYVVIEPGATVGARTVIHAGTIVGTRAQVGADCLLYPHVILYADTVLGDRVIIHSGAVIGSDGFGYTTEEGTHLKILHLGRVVIEDDVEIGANTTVDRGTLGETRIGRGAKIDNLVQVAHNVTIGAGVIVLALAGIAGSATIGPQAIVTGQVGVGDHRTIGAGARVLARAGVTRDVPPGATVSGYPVRDHREELRIEAAVVRLPDLVRRLRALEARLDAFERDRGR